MKYPLVLLGCALSLILSACTQTQSYARAVISVKKATHSVQSPHADITYILFQQKGEWQLTEQSCGTDPANQHIRKYGTISEEEAQSILAAAAELGRTQKGTRGTLVPPGGGALEAPFCVKLFTQASMDNMDKPWVWKNYKSSDDEDRSYRRLLSAMRAVAKKHGSVLPLIGELNEL